MKTKDRWRSGCRCAPWGNTNRVVSNRVVSTRAALSLQNQTYYILCFLIRPRLYASVIMNNTSITIIIIITIVTIIIIIITTSIIMIIIIRMLRCSFAYKRWAPPGGGRAPAGRAAGAPSGHATIIIAVVIIVIVMIIIIPITMYCYCYYYYYYY